MQNKNDFIKEENCKILYKRRDFLDENRIKISESFDKYLLSFATGSLYLSVYFTNNLKGQLNSKEFLKYGWILLIICISSSLLAFYASKKAYDRQIQDVDAELCKHLNGEKVLVNKNNCWPCIIGILNWATIIGFVFGVTCLAIFYFKNIGGI